MAKKRNKTDEAAMANDAAPFIEEIARGADEEVERILSRARRTAEARLGAAKDKVNAEVEKIVGVAEMQAEVERRRISSDLSLERKKIVLKARGELVEEALGRVRRRLDQTRGTPEYRALLMGLVMEGILALDRPEVAVSVSASDAKLANAAFFDEVANEVVKECGRAVKVSCEADLGDSEMGAIVRAADGSVLYDNTVGARMERMADELQLVVSHEVFADELG
jgi:V/A-type H+-transporting ATPase subunit E